MSDLVEIVARVEKLVAGASPGPWAAHNVSSGNVRFAVIRDSLGVCLADLSGQNFMQDAQFAALATHLPALLRALAVFVWPFETALTIEQTRENARDAILAVGKALGPEAVS